MNKIRVLASTYHGAFLYPGGGEVEIVQVMSRLQSMGIEVDMYGNTSRPLMNYDVVLHFSVHGEGYSFVETAKNADRKIILWPNLWWTEQPKQADIANALRFFQMADLIIFKSQAELNNVRQYLEIDQTKLVIVDLPVARAFLDPVENNLFKKTYQLDAFFLWVGVLQRERHQLKTIRALAEIDMPMVFIGNNNDPEYFDECRKIAPSNYLFIPFMPHKSKILISAMSSCSMYIEISPEPAGLSALEAGSLGTNMVLNDSDWTDEIFENHVGKARIGDEDSIFFTVKQRMDLPTHNLELSRIIQNRHITGDPLQALVTSMKEICQTHD
ncbi:MAG: glycosyltransferase [Lentilitoribacter sp.]